MLDHKGGQLGVPRDPVMGLHQEEEGEISDVDDNDGNADEEEEEGEQEEDPGVPATFNAIFFVNMISPRPEVVRWRSQFPPGHFTRRGGPVVVEARASTGG